MTNPVELPWKSAGRRSPIESKDPGLLVDLRRCIGCHACSVACKTEHGVPLGEFRMRVRWLPHPDKPTISFLPVFDDSLCDLGTNRAGAGLPPACVAACPTEALVFGDRADPESRLSKLTKKLDARPIESAEANLKEGVVYVGQESWQGDSINKGCELDPRDPDIIYEQR